MVDPISAVTRREGAAVRRTLGDLALVLVATLVSSCGGDDSGDAAATRTASSAVPFDQSFIDAMVPHHQSAIEMAEAAKQAGLTQEDLVQIADDIVSSQQREIDQMLDWREQWFGSRNVDPAAASALGMSDAEMGMEHDAAEIANADDVDAAFAEAMIPHHEGAVAMAKMAEEQGEHEEIKTLAGEIVAAQEREIEILQEHAGGMHHGS